MCAQPQAGGIVAVIGDGTISLLAVQIARLFSPTTIIVLGSRDERLIMARRLGATHIINTRQSDPRPLIQELSQGRGVDLVFEGGTRPAGVAPALDIVVDRQVAALKVLLLHI